MGAAGARRGRVDVVSGRSRRQCIKHRRLRETRLTERLRRSLGSTPAAASPRTDDGRARHLPGGNGPHRDERNVGKSGEKYTERNAEKSGVNLLQVPLHLESVDSRDQHVHQDTTGRSQSPSTDLTTARLTHRLRHHNQPPVTVGRSHSEPTSHRQRYELPAARAHSQRNATLVLAFARPNCRANRRRPPAPQARRAHAGSPPVGSDCGCRA